MYRIFISRVYNVTLYIRVALSTLAFNETLLTAHSIGCFMRAAQVRYRLIVFISCRPWRRFCPSLPLVCCFFSFLSEIISCCVCFSYFYFKWTPMRWESFAVQILLPARHLLYSLYAAAICVPSCSPAGCCCNYNALTR